MSAMRVNDDDRVSSSGGFVTTAHTSIDPALSATVYMVCSNPTTTSVRGEMWQYIRAKFRNWLLKMET